jgi:class 3 adenylate cyclase
MIIRHLQDVDEALGLAVSVSTPDLYTIWSRRLPVLTSAKKEDSVHEGSLSPVNWLQSDLGTVIAFVKQALAKQEYLLVCDVYEEAKTYWDDDARRSDGGPQLRQMVALASCCATAKTRLGLTRSARNILEPFAHDPNLGPLEQAEVLLQIGDIVREESYSGPDAPSRRVSAAGAMALYQRALVLNPDSLYGLALNGAMQLRSSGHDPASQAEARASASRALARVEKIEREHGPSYQTSWFRAAGTSIMGRFDEAFALYAKLKDVPGVTTEDLADARFRSQFIAEALGLPRQYFYAAFPLLQLLVFSGHVTDLPGAAPRFPLDSIRQVREALRKKLDQLDARVGFLSAAAGADLLFIEALQERPGTRYHIVLPWSKDEFFRTRVAPYEPIGSPPIWEPLFRKALEGATTVRELGQVYEPGDSVGWEFTQEVTAGLALHTARISRLDLQPVALWDGRSGSEPGGPHSFVELWSQQLRREPELIDLPLHSPLHLRSQQTRDRTERLTTRLEVKSMLFADIVGYSKLTEKVVADFVEVFMQRLSILLSTSPHAPRSLNTWGDAIYAVFDFSRDAALFALALTKMIRDGEDEWKKRGLVYLEREPGQNELVKRPLNIRVGLHTGPVLAHYNPVLRQIDYAGSHVNRAARIEPIAETGEVYASEEFAAMAELGKEISRRNPGMDPNRQEGFICEYAGSKALAKGYPGLFRIYRVIPEQNVTIEELARAAYALNREQQTPEDKVRTISSTSGSWEELSEDLREAHRLQVADIPNQFYELGYQPTAAGDAVPSEIAITLEQFEILSRQGHERWMAERQRQGWTYGSTRDDAHKHDPSLIPWKSLPDDEKQKSRGQIHNIPLLVRKAGFQIRKIA